MDTKRKAIGIFGIAAIVAICALVLTSGVVSAADITVPSAGNETIQQAINNASAGDTILVNATAYAGTKETVDVTQSNIIIRSVNGRAVIDANGANDDVVNITDQTNVTLDGFTIRGASASSNDVAGIYMYNATRCSISNNIVTNVSATGQNNVAYGIYLYSSSNNSFSSSISVSTIMGINYAYGISLYSSSNNSFSTDTTVSTIITSADGPAYGIFINSSSVNKFNSTAVSSIHGGLIAHGIWLKDSDHNRFSSSTSVSTITAYGYAYGIYLDGSSNNRFNSSTSVSNISGKGAYGIYLDGSSNNRFNSSTSVSNITATSEDTYGIRLSSANNNSFSSSISVFNITVTNEFALITDLFAYGLYLSSANNNSFSSSISVSNITATKGFAYGLYLSSANNNSFSSMTNVSNISAAIAYGIYLDGSSNNRFNSSTSVSTITATMDFACGLYLSSANNNSFSSMTNVSNISAAIAYGIYLDGSSNNRFNSSTSVSTITATYRTAYGIGLMDSSNNTFSSSTSVSNITATSEDAYGIRLIDSSNNTFSSSTSVSNITATSEDAYGICVESNSDDNNFTGVTIHPTLNGSESYEFYSSADCDDNVVTDMTLGNQTTISFTYRNGVWVKRVETSERPADPANVCTIKKYINASNLRANSWLCVNFSYSESDVAFVDETTLSVWKHNGTTWNEEGWNESRVLDNTNNVVGVNITRFCIFAPLGIPLTTVTIPTATGTGNATITTSSGYFCNATALNDSYFPSVPDSALTFLHGFFNITICGLNDTNPENVTINFTFPSTIPTDAEFWKYNSSNGTWYPYPFEDNDGDNVISITITDNGPGDHNPANGTINDPNGIGWRQPAEAPVPAVTPLGLVALVGLLSAIAAVTITKRKRR